MKPVKLMAVPRRIASSEDALFVIWYTKVRSASPEDIGGIAENGCSDRASGGPEGGVHERCRDIGQFGRARQVTKMSGGVGPAPGGSMTAFAGPEKTTNASRASEAIKDLFFMLFLVVGCDFSFRGF